MGASEMGFLCVVHAGNRSFPGGSVPLCVVSKKKRGAPVGVELKIGVPSILGK